LDIYKFYSSDPYLTLRVLANEVMTTRLISGTEGVKKIYKKERKKERKKEKSAVCPPRSSI